MTSTASTTVSQVALMSAVELAANIRDRSISCHEVMVAYLDQIDAHNPKVNAIVSRVDRETLLAAATASDVDIVNGQYRGWMHGLPHAVKDMAFTRGIRTTLGSLLFEHFVPPFDSFFVERLRSAGAILIGKTNTPEFG